MASGAPNLVLAGFMGTGKSTVGPLVARRLGRPFLDTDALVEADAGMSVAEIFAHLGEPAFREMERRVCLQVAEMRGHVVAVGGGAIVDQANREALLGTGVVVLLACEQPVLLARLEESARRGERPMLAGDLDARLAFLLAERAAAYNALPHSIDTTDLSPEQVVERLLDIYDKYSKEKGPGMQPVSVDSQVSEITVHSPDGDYPVILGHALLAQIDERAHERDLGRRVVVATDSNVAPLYGEPVLSSLRSAGFDAHQAIMPAGEEHKGWPSVELYISKFIEAGLDRGGWVLALGGGVVGDTAGFAASIYMRGVTLVQAPTTLLAMADSSVGGKVGVDHPLGKNLIGSFKQPSMVLADLDSLSTLPAEQIACGMAEIIKAGIIADPELFDFVETAPVEGFDYGRALLSAIAVKRDIVQRDPHERGERALLNLGHTFGHAFERCTGYSTLHGFAVAQGTAVAFRLAGRLGICDPALEERVCRAFRKWGLPVRWGGSSGLDDSQAVDRVWDAMRLDKKRRDGQLALVLPEAIGRVRVVQGVAEATIKQVLGEMQW